MAKKLAIRTERAPAPLQGAPYSQAVRVDNLVFVSGQIALRAGEIALADPTVAEWTEQASLALPGSERGSILDPHQSQAVVRVAKRRRQGRPMGHWAPRILMSPGSAARNAPRPVGWPLRVSFGRPRVVVLVLPVQAPFVAHA